MNKTMLKIVAFGVAVIGFYMYITVYVTGLSGTGGGGQQPVFLLKPESKFSGATGSVVHATK